MKYLLPIAAMLLVGSSHTYADPPITAVAVAPDGKQVVLGSQLGIEIRSLPDLNVTGKLATQLEHVHDLKFSPDGQSLLAAGGSPAQSGQVEVWNWPKRERIHETDGHEDVVYRVAWSPDGAQWLSCSGDGRCFVFSARTGQHVAQYEGHSRGALAGVFLDEHVIASAGIDQTIRLWNVTDGSHQRTLDNHAGTVNDIALQPSSANGASDIVATVSEDRTVRVWKPRIGRLVRFTRLASVPRCLAWSSDGKKLHVGCNDGHVRVVDAETMEIEAEIDGRVGRIYELVVDSAGKYVVTAGERRVCILLAKDFEERR